MNKPKLDFEIVLTSNGNIIVYTTDSADVKKEKREAFRFTDENSTIRNSQ